VYALYEMIIATVNLNGCQSARANKLRCFFKLMSYVIIDNRSCLLHVTDSYVGSCVRSVMTGKLYNAAY